MGDIEGEKKILPQCESVPTCHWSRKQQGLFNYECKRTRDNFGYGPYRQRTHSTMEKH